MVVLLVCFPKSTPLCYCTGASSTHRCRVCIPSSMEKSQHTLGYLPAQLRLCITVHRAAACFPRSLIILHDVFRFCHFWVQVYHHRDPLCALAIYTNDWRSMWNVRANHSDCQNIYSQLRSLLDPGWTPSRFEVLVLWFSSSSFAFPPTTELCDPHSMCSGFIDCLVCVCRVEDYWLGYKLFCYAYYSHSVTHQNKFKVSKLGWCIFPFRGAKIFSFSVAWRSDPLLCARHVWSLRVPV